MIHWTPEGHALKSGLNIYFTRFKKYHFWFSFVWLSVDLSTHLAKINYFRFRSFFWPLVITDKSIHNIIEHYLVLRDEHIVSRTLLDKWVPKDFQIVHCPITGNKCL